MEIDQATLSQMLSRCPLLDGLDIASMQMLMQQIQLKSYPKGVAVLQEGEHAEFLCFLLEGRLKVVTFTSSGKEVGLSVLEPVTHFGEMALIDNQPRSASVLTATKSLIGIIPKAAALKWLLEEPSISVKLMRDLVQMLRNTNQQLLLMGYQHAQTRIAALLLQILSEQGQHGNPSAQLSQQEIANMANTSRETVSRVLNQFVEKGILKRNGRELLLNDVTRLKQALLDVG